MSKSRLDSSCNPVLEPGCCVGAKEVLYGVYELHQSAVAALKRHRQMAAAVQGELRQAAGQQPEHNAPASQHSKNYHAATAQTTDGVEAGLSSVAEQQPGSNVPANQHPSSCDADTAQCGAFTSQQANGCDTDSAQTEEIEVEAECADADADSAQAMEDIEASGADFDMSTGSAETLERSETQSDLLVGSKRKRDADGDEEGGSRDNVISWMCLPGCTTLGAHVGALQFYAPCEQQRAATWAGGTGKGEGGWGGLDRGSGA